jgi:hypothetical protein
MKWLDRLFEPVWAGGWAATRVIYAVVCLAFFVPRAWALADAYAAPDMVFSAFPFYLADHVRLTLRTAWILWFGGVAGLLAILAGGRWMRPGLLLWVFCNWVLLAEEAVNIKAHDRLGLWIALGLLISPAGGRGLTQAWRSPAARWYLLIVYCGIYGSTGWLKLLDEPAWFKGDVLAYHLVHRHFAGGPLAAWLSGQPWLTRPMGWTTVIFEASFPLWCWFRRTNPWVLLVAASFHLGVAVLMNVGPFSFIALSSYPVLLHPEVARGLWERVRSRLP